MVCDIITWGFCVPRCWRCASTLPLWIPSTFPSWPTSEAPKKCTLPTYLLSVLLFVCCLFVGLFKLPCNQLSTLQQVFPPPSLPPLFLPAPPPPPPPPHAPAVRGAIFHLLGRLCELYPEVMMGHSEKLVGIFMRTLKSEMVSKAKKKPDMPVIGGVLRGLCSYLVNFSQSVAEGTVVLP